MTDAHSLLMARTAWAFGVLAAEIARGRSLGYIPGEAPATGDPLAARQLINQQLGRHAITQQLVRAGCTEAEQDSLWLLACSESEPAIARLVEALHGGSDKPSIAFLERVFGCDVEAMRARGLVRVDGGDGSRNRRGVQLVACLREVLFGHPDHREPREEGTLDELAIAGDAAARVREAIGGRVTVVVAGLAGLGRRSLLVRVSAEAGLALRTLDATTLTGTDDEVRERLRELALRCRLAGAAPLVLEVDALGDRAALVGAELGALATPILATCGAQRPKLDWGRPAIVIELERPGTAQLAALWHARLGQGTAEDAQRVAEQYPLVPALIEAVAASARARAASRAMTIADVRAGLDAVLDDRLGQLARRVRVTQTWDDIVLPDDQLDTVFELIARVRRRSQVYERWGFAAKVGRGLGVTALFSGPPGTGKTMIAALVARELGLALYQVDLGKLVSKFIGETEKNLAALFDAAEAAHAILLFDEADSLFGKRTDVKSSNDRYANLETNYLLQRLESFSGICLLTSNHERNIDPAFERRLSLHLRFQLPDVHERARLWRAVLPAAAPLDAGVDLDGLARRFEMSGGYIKNAALRAAFLAADEDSAITAMHLERAARVEYEGMGKLVA